MGGKSERDLLKGSTCARCRLAIRPAVEQLLCSSSKEHHFHFGPEQPGPPGRCRPAFGSHRQQPFGLDCHFRSPHRTLLRSGVSNERILPRTRNRNVLNARINTSQQISMEHLISGNQRLSEQGLFALKQAKAQRAVVDSRYVPALGGTSFPSSPMNPDPKVVYELRSISAWIRTNRSLLRDRRLIAVPPKAFETLLVFGACTWTGRNLYSKEELLNAIWPDSFVEERRP